MVERSRALSGWCETASTTRRRRVDESSSFSISLTTHSIGPELRRPHDPATPGARQVSRRSSSAFPGADDDIVALDRRHAQERQDEARHVFPTYLAGALRPDRRPEDETGVLTTPTSGMRPAHVRFWRCSRHGPVYYVQLAMVTKRDNKVKSRALQRSITSFPCDAIENARGRAASTEDCAKHRRP